MGRLVSKEDRSWRRLVASLTVEQHHGLLERDRLADLKLAEWAEQDANTEEEDEGRAVLDALAHALQDGAHAANESATRSLTPAAVSAHSPL